MTRQKEGLSALDKAWLLLYILRSRGNQFTMKKIFILLYISFAFLTPTIVLAGEPITKPSGPGEGAQLPEGEPVGPTIPEPKPK